MLQGVPMLTSLLVDAGTETPQRASCDPHRRRHAAGAAVRLPGPLTNARFYNVYGCTETNDSFVETLDVAQDGPIGLGDPLPGVRHQVVESGRVVEGAGSGELWVSTPFQASGYLGGPSSDDGFGADGFYRSRDLVRRDASGRLFLDGAHRRTGQGPRRPREPAGRRTGAPRRRSVAETSSSRSRSLRRS